MTNLFSLYALVVTNGIFAVGSMTNINPLPQLLRTERPNWVLSTNWVPATAPIVIGPMVINAIYIHSPEYPHGKPLEPDPPKVYYELGTIVSNLVLKVHYGTNTHQLILESKELWQTNRAYTLREARDYK